jgi:hypothetical protein
MRLRAVKPPPPPYQMPGIHIPYCGGCHTVPRVDLWVLYRCVRRPYGTRHRQVVDVLHYVNWRRRRMTSRRPVEYVRLRGVYVLVDHLVYLVDRVTARQYELFLCEIDARSARTHLRRCVWSSCLRFFACLSVQCGHRLGGLRCAGQYGSFRTVFDGHSMCKHCCASRFFTLRVSDLAVIFDSFHLWRYSHCGITLQDSLESCLPCCR